jgi:hypothetical protein
MHTVLIFLIMNNKIHSVATESPAARWRSYSQNWMLQDADRLTQQQHNCRESQEYNEESSTQDKMLQGKSEKKLTSYAF